MLNTRSEEHNAVFFSYVPCFVNTSTSYSLHIQGKSGGIRDSNSYGCATRMREYVFNMQGEVGSERR